MTLMAKKHWPYIASSEWTLCGRKRGQYATAESEQAVTCASCAHSLRIRHDVLEGGVR